MDTLTKEELEALAEMRNSLGFKVMLKLFEKELNLIQDILLTETDPEKELALVSRWREFKRIYNCLKNDLEFLAKEMASASIQDVDEPYSDTFDQKIFDTYRKKMFAEVISPKVDVN